MALTKEKKRVLDLIRNEPYLLGRMVGFSDLTELHNEWIKDFLFDREDRTLLAHRGSYKTTCISLFFAIHIIIRPNENILFFRKTDDDVAEVIHTTSNMLSSGAFKRIVSILYGCDLGLVTATASKVHTNLCTSTKGSAQLLGLGVGTSVTGKHAEIVVTDDIVNKKDRVSAPERLRTSLLYQELQNIKNRGGRIINTGTPWHKEDTISTLMPNITRYDCYSTGLINKEQLKKLRQSMSPSLFAANYELKHIADENAMFGEPHFISDEAAIYEGVAHIDAAYGGEDYTAYTILKKQADGKIVGFGKLWQKHVDDCLVEIHALHERYRAGSISNETNGDKGYLAKELKGLGFEVNTYAETTNKYIKISTHLRKAWDDIYWLDDTDPEYLAQILDYTENAVHDDAPDSAASLLRNMAKKKYTYNRNAGGGL